MTLTAAALAKLAFDAVIQTGVGKLTEAALEQGKLLWHKIRGKVKEEGVKEDTLIELEKTKSQEILEKQVVPFLQVAILKDKQFDQEIQSIAQQINQEIQGGSEDNIKVTANSYDQSKQNIVGKIDADRVNFS